MTKINVRQKGASGEREVAKMLNAIVVRVMTELGCDPDKIEAAQTGVQRNQNQSAVGGCDLTNVFGMSVEVKRQENLSLPAWWRQCEQAAERNRELPVLIYRQNRKPWRVRTYAWLVLPGVQAGQWDRKTRVLADFSEDDFKQWFEQWVRCWLEQGNEVRT